MGSQTHQLDRLGRELKCPICLSLLQQAASLTCNHTFCRSCILQSMKSTPACPICKVHTTRREVRAAPQMDSLVAIFVSMGSAAGLDIMTSQNIPPTGEPIQPPTTSKSRTPLSNITNRLHIPKEKKSSDYIFKGAIPAKKRIQVPQPSILQKELEYGRHSPLQSHVFADKCGLTAVDASPQPDSRNKRKGSPNEFDASRSHLSSSKKVYKRAKKNDYSEPSCSKQVDSEALGNLKETLIEASDHVQASPNRRKHKVKAGKDMVPLPQSQLNNVEKDSNRPTRDDSSRRKLDPFFWLRDESSQDIDAIQVTQLTLTQSTVKPNFSDLKDSDDEVGLGANEVINNDIVICEPGSYDSDDFDWTQHPSSPELRCSPSKNQGSTKDLVIDIPLEASHPSPKELLLNAQNTCKRYSQEIMSTEALLESTSKVSSIAQENLAAALRVDQKMRKSRRMKSHDETQKAINVSVRDVRTQSTNHKRQNHPAGCSNDRQQSELPVCYVIPSEETGQIEPSANSKKNTEKRSKGKSKHVQENNTQSTNHKWQNKPAGCSNDWQRSELPVCDVIPSEETKQIELSANRKRNVKKLSKLKSKRVQENNVAGCSIKSSSTPATMELKNLKASSNMNSKKPGKIPKRKRDPESNPNDARIDNVISKSENSKDSVEPCLSLCVFCGASEESQITGTMVHFNKQGIPLAEPGQDGKLVHAHKHCAEWAPDVYFVEDEARNLFAEAARGLKIKCFSCGKRGAALGCCIKRCRRSYHYPCARALSCKWEEERFIMLCPEHKTEKFPVKKNRRPAKPTQKSSLHLQIKLPGHAEPGSITEEIAVKWTSNQSSKWVLCGSALDAVGKNLLATFAKVTGATISKSWSLNVTHVIAGTDPQGAARRTMKFLMAILEGKWVVKLDWLEACIEAGKPVNEEPFEIATDIHGAIEGPKHGRLRAAGEGQKLFGKLQFYFMPDFLSSYKGDLQALVMAGGGEVLHRKPVASVDDDARQRKTIVVYNNETPSSDKKADRGRLLSKRQGEAKELAAYAGANVVSHQWILDSIGASKVQSL